MSTNSPAGESRGNKVYAKVQADVHSNSVCSFCWFVMSLYPTLKGMTPRDTATFREHLKNTHGLTDEIKQ